MNQYRNREEDPKDDISFRFLCGYVFDEGSYTDFLIHGLKKTGIRPNSDLKNRILDSVEGAEDICTYSTSTAFG